VVAGFLNASAVDEGLSPHVIIRLKNADFLAVLRAVEVDAGFLFIVTVAERRPGMVHYPSTLLWSRILRLSGFFSSRRRW